MTRRKSKAQAKERPDKVVVLACVASIVLIEAWAIVHGIDGIALTASAAALAGIGGYHLKLPIALGR